MRLSSDLLVWLWTLIAALGTVASAKRALLSYGDIRYLVGARLDSVRAIRARARLRSEASGTFVFSLFVAIGLASVFDLPADFRMWFGRTSIVVGVALLVLNIYIDDRSDAALLRALGEREGKDARGGG